ncbi:hypothetical protein QKT48_gp01 [Macropodid alphaherpesvirus 4]|uniref:Uncharacterized protein n=1 Tax=Macropodid alphaherpesvirus 4 TaxID=2762721 RepID=A0A7L7YUN4_9ALPH|nr:hypothetical protein QKT48_gp01 [Macropodid alphaherpesvirus 4]QOD40156.1 hypothetical protein [Macropodid alphaherpesvirus 4]
MSPRRPVRIHAAAEALIRPGCVQPAWFKDLVGQIWEGTILIDIHARTSIDLLLSIFTRPVQYMIVKIANISEVIEMIDREFQMFCGAKPDPFHIDDYHPFAIHLIFLMATDVALQYAADRLGTIKALKEVFFNQSGDDLQSLVPWSARQIHNPQGRRANRGRGARSTNPGRNKPQWGSEAKGGSESWYQTTQRGPRQPREPRYPQPISRPAPREQQSPRAQSSKEPLVFRGLEGSQEAQQQPHKPICYYRPPRMLKPPRAPRFQRMAGITGEEGGSQNTEDEWVAGNNSYTLKDLQKAEAEACRQHAETTKLTTGGGSSDDDSPFRPYREGEEVKEAVPESQGPDDASSSGDDVPDSFRPASPTPQSTKSVAEWESIETPSPRSLHTFF